MLATEIDYIDLISNASLMVQFVLLLLLFFSVLSWAIIIVKYRYIRKAFKESAFFTEFFWKSRDLSGAFQKAKELHTCPVARIFQIGYVELKKISRAGVPANPQKGKSETTPLKQRISTTDNIKRALRRAISSELTRLTQLVPFLATAGNTAPFIGLFGTVWGIMNSFHGIGVRGSANLAVVAPGISEALIATAAGLAVAIPSVIAFNFLTQKIRIIEAELNSFSADFLNIIERDILQHKGDPR
jgi:biopolymer transport protein TolQ